MELMNKSNDAIDISMSIKYETKSELKGIMLGDILVAFSYQRKKEYLDEKGEKKTQDVQYFEGITILDEIKKIEKNCKDDPSKVFSPPPNLYRMWKKKETIDFFNNFLVASNDEIDDFDFFIKTPYTYAKQHEDRLAKDIIAVPTTLSFINDGLFLRDSISGEIVPLPVMIKIPIDFNEMKREMEEEGIKADINEWKDVVEKLGEIEKRGGTFFSIEEYVVGRDMLKKINSEAFEKRVKFDGQKEFFLDYYFAFCPSKEQLEKMLAFRAGAVFPSYGEQWIKEFISKSWKNKSKKTKEEQEKRWITFVDEMSLFAYDQFTDILKLI